MLAHGQQAHIPVIINVPRDALPGGLYGAVLVAGAPFKNVNGATNIITRIGALFFVTVDGEIKRSGRLASFAFNNGEFDLAFENNGDIYLNPYGIINIYEFDSRKPVKNLSVDPWFVLPQSRRIRSIPEGGLASGKYFAKATLNRGYDDLFDIEDISFEVGDNYRVLKISFVALLTMAIFSTLFIYARRKF